MLGSSRRCDLVVAGLGLANGAAARAWRFFGCGLGSIALIGCTDRRRQEVERDPLIILLVGLVAAVAVAWRRPLVLVAFITIVAAVAARSIATIIAVTALALVAARTVLILAVGLLLLLFDLLLVGAFEHLFVAVVGVVIVARPWTLVFEPRPALAENPEIMVGELQKVFRLHTITGQLGVTRHAFVLFKQLRGIAALAVVLAITAGLTAHSLGTLPAATAPAAAALSIIDQMPTSLPK